jgi:hypothetical protein
MADVNVVLSEKTDVPQIVVLPVDPLNGPTAMLLPFISQRIYNMASERMAECDPRRFTQALMARLWAGDPAILLLAMLEPSGKLVGHVTAELCTDNVKKWVFVHQTKADGNVGDAVRRAITILDQWAASLKDTTNPAGVPVTLMTMATHRNDAAWQRKYGLEAHRQVLMREVGSPIGQPSS